MHLLGAAVHADVYKWIDAEGHVHFTDRPPPTDGRLVSIGQTARTVTLNGAEATPEATKPGPADLSAATTPKPTPIPPPTDSASLARLKASVAADVAARDAIACQTARERYQQYVSARRLYRTGEQSDRQYLSDAEMEAARIQARHDVEELCGQGP
jgi:hypothetical protein